ncbi:hypothetical protein BLNAU_7074 [Blattamonas nauphoetae]|uniref:Uncharacterized protein n=1 Tax=Blattamonas nauphoetae TaxID=2049346 RepID=A0ABQ9Y2C6_9EUKA|nr:hypothetical protein BLNAU_7074 [Blattamonas nauphoetae]
MPSISHRYRTAFGTKQKPVFADSSAVLILEKTVGGQMDCYGKTQTIQEKIGGMIVRHFRSSIHSSQKETGSIGIDLAAVRREMEEERIMIRQEREKEKREMEMREKEREIAARKVEEERQKEREKEKETTRKAEEERQREYSRKMREMEEMKKTNEKWIEEGRQRNLKEVAAAIEVFNQHKITLIGNVLTSTQSEAYIRYVCQDSVCMSSPSDATSLSDYTTARYAK